MAGRAPALFHGHRGQRRRPDHVARGVHAAHRGLEILVHAHVTAFGELDTGRLEIQAVDIGAAPQRHQHLVGADRAAIAEVGAHLRDAVPAQRRGLGAWQVFTAVAPQLVEMKGGELGIQKRQRLRELVGLGDLAAERREHGGVFARDDATAQHQQAARQVGQRQDGVTVQQVFVIHRQVCRRARP